MSTLDPQPSQHAFRLFPSSPLSALDPNAYNVGRAFNMTCRKTNDTPALKKPSLFTSSRVSQRPSLTHRDPQKEREKKRFQYLNKVKEKGDEKRFEARNDQLQRLDALSERRAWEEQRQKEAAEWSLDPERWDETDEDELIVEDFASQEQQEWEAIMSSISAPTSSLMDHSGDQDKTNYSSEDEDYDALMMETLLQVEGRSSAASRLDPGLDGDMDVSMG